MTKKILISIILLVGIVTFQSYKIYNDTYSGYMFDSKYDVDLINTNFLVLSYNLLTIKDMVPVNDDTVLSVFANDSDNKYAMTLQYWVNKMNFYPINLPRNHKHTPLEIYSDKTFSDSINKNKNDYIVLVGRNLNILNVETEKDISLYKVINKNKLELILDFNNTLFSLKNNSKSIGKPEYFDTVINYIENNINNYSNLYGDYAYNYIYEFANELFSNGYKEESKKYYNLYLSINSLEPTVLLRKASIYLDNGDYTNALFMVDYCEQLVDCNKEISQSIRKDMEVVE